MCACVYVCDEIISDFRISGRGKTKTLLFSKQESEMTFRNAYRIVIMCKCTHCNNNSSNKVTNFEYLFILCSSMTFGNHYRYIRKVCPFASISEGEKKKKIEEASSMCIDFFKDIQGNCETSRCSFNHSIYYS